MAYRILAELTMATHFAFLLFVVVGGFLVVRRAWVAALHLPAFLWGAALLIMGWICPLTPLENRLRRMAGEEGYDTGFIDHYLASVVYPQGLTRAHQILIGLAVLLLNAAIYAWVLRRRRDARDSTGSAPRPHGMGPA
jgi:hypothetical protein